MNTLLSSLGLNATNPGTYSDRWLDSNAGLLDSYSPIDGKLIAQVQLSSDADYEQVVKASQATFDKWRMLPAPQRGEIVRQMGDELRKYKEPLGKLVALEMGKILSEGLGEVQEAIDIADFAVGLSRQLYGLSMHSERPGHRMYEQWHPLGPVGTITAFNFPVAVWAWNAMIAAVCGDTVIWKPSDQTPLCALATTKICAAVAARHGFPGLFGLVVDRAGDHGKKLAADRRVPIVSATGSCRMGRSVGEAVARRMGRSLLELGGNNAVVIMDDAKPDLALRAVLFGAVGTAGQRCTTIRRLLLQRGIAPKFTEKLIAAYKQIKIGNPLHDGVLMGPLINQAAVKSYQQALEQAQKQGGKILCGGKVVPGLGSDLYVEPTIVEARADMPIVQEETFAPILYLITVKDEHEAIALNNGVAQGLSSAIFTQNVQSAERFLSHAGSDCGIANVNIGTSGAEIGGAFGGEKDTGGGREAGSDSWKQYMRRQTVTINWSDELPLAQGVKFDL